MMSDNRKDPIKVTPWSIFLILILVPLLMVPIVAISIALQKISSRSASHEGSQIASSSRAGVESALRLAAEKAADRFLTVPKLNNETGAFLIKTSKSQFQSKVEEIKFQLRANHLQFIENAEGFSDRFVFDGVRDHQQLLQLLNEIEGMNERAGDPEGSSSSTKSDHQNNEGLISITIRGE